MNARIRSYRRHLLATTAVCSGPLAAGLCNMAHGETTLFRPVR